MIGTSGSAGRHEGNAVSPPTILVVDDDPAARTLVSTALERDGFAVIEAATAADARQATRSRQVDLVVLDLGLPDEQGLDWLTDLRRVSSTPVVVLTGRSNVEDRVVGLRLGADDYLVKPFSPQELAARIAAVLRRTGRSAVPDSLRFGDVEIDLISKEVLANGAVIDLTKREFELLAFLAAHPRQTFTRDQLLVEVWNSSQDWQHPATVTQHVRRVRNKLDDAGVTSPGLTTVRGMGYRFDP